jgi:hypothetical protein
VRAPGPGFGRVLFSRIFAEAQHDHEQAQQMLPWGLIEGIDYNLSPAEPIVGDQIHYSCISNGSEAFASYCVDAAGI